MVSKWMTRFALLTLAISVAACGGKEETDPDTPTPPEMQQSDVETPGEYQVITVSDGGSVSGTVTFDGEVPEAEIVAITKDPEACGNKKEIRTIVVGAGGGLSGAVVYLEDIGKGKDFSDGTGSVDQKKCEYTPFIQGIKKGTKLEILNSDPALHNIHAYLGNKTLFNQAQNAGGPPLNMKMKKAGAVELKCDVHSWMQSWIFVSDHPYFHVTGDDGAFELTDVPAGTYKLKAWHPELDSQDASVEVAAGGTASHDFTFQ